MSEKWKNLISALDEFTDDFMNDVDTSGTANVTVDKKTWEAFEELVTKYEAGKLEDDDKAVLIALSRHIVAENRYYSYGKKD